MTRTNINDQRVIMITCSTVDDDLNPVDVRKVFYVGYDPYLCAHLTFWRAGECCVHFALECEQSTIADMRVDLPPRVGMRTAVFGIDLRKMSAIERLIDHDLEVVASIDGLEVARCDFVLRRLDVSKEIKKHFTASFIDGYA
ncbi:hypothetical protein [Alicyclobacillus sendaiensis]|uniref:hypothetical protein n=1 Tax=Alicyclobacillus sendaiensis TaxID=192387 RepID=UPI0026F46544|nr:hypothetical protein [Alicyclobacillus sendaiensis]